MATLNHQNQQRHDGQKNYSNSNERNPDHARSATRKHHYKEHEETLTNDENYSLNSKQIKGDPEFDDKGQNQEKTK